ncbi:MAG: hypothetical protein AAF280_10350 [Pseudomonadota bacterium]
MHIILHAGAHATDENRLVQCLLKNSEHLDAIGTAVPDPESYRNVLRDAIADATGGRASANAMGEAGDSLRRILSPAGPVNRLVVSNDSFFGTHKMAVKRMFYPASCARLEALRQLLPDDTIELFFAVRNPATFMPALLEITNYNAIEDLFRGYDPLSFRWSELFERIRAQIPDIPITVWCNEDTPLIWAELIREMGGLDPTQEIEGEFELLEEIMTEAGMKRFLTYMQGHPGMTEVQKRRVIAAFLDKFVDEDAVEEEYELEGWTDHLIDQMTELYEEDVFNIPRVPGVTLITP